MMNKRWYTRWTPRFMGRNKFTQFLLQISTNNRFTNGQHQNFYNYLKTIHVRFIMQHNKLQKAWIATRISLFLNSIQAFIWKNYCRYKE